MKIRKGIQKRARMVKCKKYKKVIMMRSELELVKKLNIDLKVYATQKYLFYKRYQ
jgi:hypothetical protein